MRIYWSRLLEDFGARGGDVITGAVQSQDLEAISAQFDLAASRGLGPSCRTCFSAASDHSPFQAPQRTVVAALLRGIAYREPLGFEVVVVRGPERFSVPMCSFEPGLTAVGIEIIRGGPFMPLTALHYREAPGEVEAFILGLLRDHAPAVYARIDSGRFRDCPAARHRARGDHRLPDGHARVSRTV